MKTITIKINERTKAGKAFLAVTNFFIDTKDIEIIETPKTKAVTKKYPVSKNIPNAETVKAMQDTEDGIGLTRVKNSKDFFKQMGI